MRAVTALSAAPTMITPSPRSLMDVAPIWSGREPPLSTIDPQCRLRFEVVSEQLSASGKKGAALAYLVETGAFPLGGASQELE